MTAAVFVIAGVLAGTLAWHLERQRARLQQSVVGNLAAAHAHMLHDRLEQELTAAYAVAALVRESKGAAPTFESFARELLKSYPRTVTLSLAPGGVIRRIVPAGGALGAIGGDLLKDPVHRQESALARDTGRMALAGPIDLPSGARGVVGRLPIYLDDGRGGRRFWGLVNVAIRLPDALNIARLDELASQGFVYRLWRVNPSGNQRELIAGSPSETPLRMLDQALAVPNANWVLSIAPRRGWGDPFAMALEWSLVFLFSALAAALTHRWISSRALTRRLGAEVQRQTAEVRLREADLGRAEAMARLGSLVFDRNGALLRASPEGGRISGLSGQSASGFADFLQRVHPDDRADLTDCWERACAGKDSAIEHRLMRGGEIRWLRHLMRLERDPEGIPVRVLATVQDVTERRQSQDALQHVLMKYEALFDAFPLGIAVTDAGGRILEANSTAESLLGLSQEALESRALDALEWTILRTDGTAMPTEEFAGARALRDRRLVSGAEMGVVRPEGDVVWLSVTAAPIPLEEGGVLIVLGDIGERLRTDLELRIAATVFESQEGMMVTDARGVILRVNRAFAENAGYSPEELLGKTPRIFQSGRHDRAFYDAMWDCILRTGSWKGEVWNRRKSGEIYPEWLTISAVKNRDGVVTNYVGTHTDITQRKEVENEIRDLAYFDPLTHLPNRRLLMDRLHLAIANSARSQRQGALIFIDLDRFKTLNDTLGHHVGDELLKQVAQRLHDCVREGDTVARLGGDEFVVMLPDLGLNPDAAAGLARVVGEKILTRLDQPYELVGHPYRNTPSIGVILFSGQDSSADDLLKHADLAMYQAKAAGRNTLRFFDPSMQAALATRASLEADLQAGVDSGQLLLHYQPQVDASERMIGVEALVRWMHPRHGWVSPAEIIQLAESTGQMILLGRWILETACAQLARWADHAEFGQLTLAVNIAASQFRHPSFVALVQSVLAESGADPRRLRLELTESFLLDSMPEAIAKMDALKESGVGFALDNFGTGYCALSFLRRLPLDQLKIDPVFVQNILNHPNAEAIARAFMELARSCGLEVLAEGVETDEQRVFLVRQGCRAFQGYLFGRPVPADALGAATAD